MLVTVQKISSIIPIQGADKIVCASLEAIDYSFVIPINRFNIGDECLYFPVDAILPKPLVTRLGLDNKLAGAQQNRIKTVIIRGCPSQGVVTDLSLLAEYGLCKNDTPERITEVLGVTKYEPEESYTAEGILIHTLPDGLSKYTISHAQDKIDEIKQLISTNAPAWVDEKLEGQLHTFTWSATSGVSVCSKNTSIKETSDGTNTFWNCARRAQLFEIVEHLKNKYPNATQVGIYSEQVGPGINGNIYKLKNHDLYAFDIMINGKFLDPEEFDANVRWIRSKNIAFKTAPRIFTGNIKDFCGESSLTKLAHGRSLISDTLREGIVIRYRCKYGGQRRILKIRDPIYLGKTGAD